jgi:hypothetical protein
MPVPEITYEWKSLSIKQPAASLISRGLKIVENRNQNQYKDKTLRGQWILIHASKGKIEDGEAIKRHAVLPTEHLDQLPRGKIIALARIEGVYDKGQLETPKFRKWANDGAACIAFDEILHLNEPVAAPGGLGTWKLKPAPEWKPSHKLSKKEAALSPASLKIWRRTQEKKYRKQSLKKRVALVKIMLAIRQGSYSTTWKNLDDKSVSETTDNSAIISIL